LMVPESEGEGLGDRGRGQGRHSPSGDTTRSRRAIQSQAIAPSLVLISVPLLFNDWNDRANRF
jgi:hypothetical protein